MCAYDYYTKRVISTFLKYDIVYTSSARASLSHLMSGCIQIYSQSANTMGFGWHVCRGDAAVAAVVVRDNRGDDDDGDVSSDACR